MSEKREMVSAEERAKACLPGCYDTTGRECSADYRCEMHHSVTKAIKAAEAQARAEGIQSALLVQYRDRNDEAVEAYEKGWRECKEAASNFVLSLPLHPVKFSREAASIIANGLGSLQPPSEAGR